MAATAPDAAVPEPPASAGELFGHRLPVAARYARMLARDGVTRGLVGPREAPRIWQRHLLNCAAVAELVPCGASVTDVGSGAGLPGVVLALVRPDLRVTLMEPMARRVTFLSEVLAQLDLTDRVRVERCRAEEAVGRVPEVDVVTARALARLDRVARWCLPLTRTGGRVLAIKGESAAREITECGSAVRDAGGGSPTVHHCGAGVLEEPTLVVSIVRGHDRSPRRRGGSG